MKKAISVERKTWNLTYWSFVAEKPSPFPGGNMLARHPAPYCFQCTLAGCLDICWEATHPPSSNPPSYLHTSSSHSSYQPRSPYWFVGSFYSSSSSRSFFFFFFPVNFVPFHSTGVVWHENMLCLTVVHRTGETFFFFLKYVFLLLCYNLNGIFSCLSSLL